MEAADAEYERCAAEDIPPEQAKRRIFSAGLAAWPGACIRTRFQPEKARNETLEEAAKVAEGKTELYLDPDTGEIHKSPMPNIIATAIRALKTSSGASGS